MMTFREAIKVGFGVALGMFAACGVVALFVWFGPKVLHSIEAHW